MNKITLHVIRTIVSRKTHLNLAKDVRNREYVYARAIFFKLAREFTTCPFKKIGDAVSRDHASVIHGLKVFDMLMLHKDEILDVYFECYRTFTSLKTDLKQGDDELYWRAKYENMKEMYVTAVERLHKYERKEKHAKLKTRLEKIT